LICLDALKALSGFTGICRPGTHVGGIPDVVEWLLIEADLHGKGGQLLVDNTIGVNLAGDDELNNEVFRLSELTL